MTGPIAGRISTSRSWWAVASGCGPRGRSRREGTIDLVVDPGRAFGTGAHPTTRLCLELLLELEAAGEAYGPLTDLGTGSGVLAIAAAKLGWDPVSGYDHEAPAIEAAAANADRQRRRASIWSASTCASASQPSRRRRSPTSPPRSCAPSRASSASRGIPERPPGPPRALLRPAPPRSSTTLAAPAFCPAGLAEAERRRDGEWAALRLRRA